MILHLVTNKLKSRIRKYIFRFLGVNFNDLQDVIRQSKPEHFLHRSQWVKFGRYSYESGAHALRWATNEQLIVGKFCSIAQDVLFLCGNGTHDLRNVSTYPFSRLTKYYGFNDNFKLQATSKGPIVVENDVWIGARVIVQSGVTIHNGAVIMAGAVVTNDVPAYSIVGGVPAKVFDYRFEGENIEKLLEVAWWDWPDSKMAHSIHDFELPVESFLALHFSK